ncbi:hypothetical protein K438DRAFT_1981569 [Mycena galopus ATCC 62051]|nr:hypothetical protein K438DRAFT_1981569 [Mycena galopus ATCC 62051]
MRSLPPPQLHSRGSPTSSLAPSNYTYAPGHYTSSSSGSDYAHNSASHSHLAGSPLAPSTKSAKSGVTTRSTGAKSGREGGGAGWESEFNLESFRHVSPAPPSPSPNSGSHGRGAPLTSSNLSALDAADRHPTAEFFSAPRRPRPRGGSDASASSGKISVAAFREVQARWGAARIPAFGGPGAGDRSRENLRAGGRQGRGRPQRKTPPHQQRRQSDPQTQQQRTPPQQYPQPGQQTPPQKASPPPAKTTPGKRYQQRAQMQSNLPQSQYAATASAATGYATHTRQENEPWPRAGGQQWESDTSASEDENEDGPTRGTGTGTGAGRDTGCIEFGRVRIGAPPSASANTGNVATRKPAAATSIRLRFCFLDDSLLAVVCDGPACHRTVSIPFPPFTLHFQGQRRRGQEKTIKSNPLVSFFGFLRTCLTPDAGMCATVSASQCSWIRRRPIFSQREDCAKLQAQSSYDVIFIPGVPTRGAANDMLFISTPHILSFPSTMRGELGHELIPTQRSQEDGGKDDGFTGGEMLASALGVQTSTKKPEQEAPNPVLTSRSPPVRSETGVVHFPSPPSSPAKEVPPCVLGSVGVFGPPASRSSAMRRETAGSAASLPAPAPAPVRSTSSASGSTRPAVQERDMLSERLRAAAAASASAELVGIVEKLPQQEKKTPPPPVAFVTATARKAFHRRSLSDIISAQKRTWADDGDN